MGRAGSRGATNASVPLRLDEPGDAVGDTAKKVWNIIF